MKNRYMRFGKGDKTMLMLPGLSIKPVTGDPKPVEDAYAMFEDEYTVYLFDPAEELHEGWTIKDSAEAVYDSIIELGLKDLYLFGVSMGGMIAQQLAIDHPELIRKMVLASTCSRADDLDNGEWLENAEKKDCLALCDSFARKVYMKSLYEQLGPVIEAMAASVTDEDLERFIILASSINSFDISDHGDNKIPVLVLGSKDDEVISFEKMKQMAKRLCAEEYYYDGYGHGVYDEAPDFKDKIKEFFERR